MNKIRRIAEDLVNRYPALFTSDFDKNKAALSQVSIIRTRSIRNQLAGAITKIIHRRGPEATEQDLSVIDEQATLEDKISPPESTKVEQTSPVSDSNEQSSIPSDSQPPKEVTQAAL